MKRFQISVVKIDSHIFEMIAETLEEACSLALEKAKLMPKAEFGDGYNVPQWRTFHQGDLGGNAPVELEGDFTYEQCPHCDTEVPLLAVMQIQKCPVCGQLIKPCSICDVLNSEVNDDGHLNCNLCKL